MGKSGKLVDNLLITCGKVDNLVKNVWKSGKNVENLRKTCGKCGKLVENVEKPYNF